MNTKYIPFIIILLTLTVSGCRCLVDKFAFHPDNETSIPQEMLPLGVEEVFIATADGIKIQCYFLPKKSSKKVLIFFHGNAGNISHRIYDLIEISQFDVNVLGVGYRGYGKSEGKPSEKGVYLDGTAALDYAINELSFNMNDIYIFGRSIGTTVAINTSQDKAIAGLILVTPLTSGKEQAKTSGLSAISFLAGASFNNIDKIQNITCPALIIHGTEDSVIPYSMGVDIYEKIQTKKRFVTINGAGHNNLSSDFKREYWKPISKFLKNGI